MVLTVLVQRDGSTSWLGSVWLGGHIPLYYLRYLSGIFFLWMLVDSFFFIRRAPAEFRKAQWATSIFMLLIYTTVSAILESIVAALDHVARA